ncbi:MAG: heme exporter protein CcmD [Pseudomonadota bacterium]
MTFYFASWSEFLAMGGHGLYVWLAYGLFFGSLGVLTWQSVRAPKRWHREQQLLLKRQQQNRSE